MNAQVVDPKLTTCIAFKVRSMEVVRDVTLERARKAGWMVAHCSVPECYGLASKLDSKFPYHTENNRCADCLKRERDSSEL